MRWEESDREDIFMILNNKNQISDFEVLANAFKDACQKVVLKFAKQ